MITSFFCLALPPSSSCLFRVHSSVRLLLFCRLPSSNDEHVPEKRLLFLSAPMFSLCAPQLHIDYDTLISPSREPSCNLLAPIFSVIEHFFFFKEMKHFEYVVSRAFFCFLSVAFQSFSAPLQTR